MIIVLSFVGAAIILAALIWLGFLTGRDRAAILNSQHFEFAGNTRQYQLVAPKQITKETKLIVGLHGFGSSGREFAYTTALHNVDSSALFAYPTAISPPKGLKTGWNAGFCCGSGFKGQIDDAGFIGALTEQLANEHGIAAGNIFVTGFSNGAFMAQRLLIERPDLFQAAALVSGSIGTVDRSAQPSTPKPVLLLHGDQDTIIPFNGGEGSSDPEFTWLPFSDLRSTWESVNSTAAQTEAHVYPGLAHVWNGWRIFNFWQQTPEASERVIEFFNTQSSSD